MNRLLIVLASFMIAGCCSSGLSERSSAIKDAEYQSDSQTLILPFPDGSRYSYTGVPQAVYDGLRKANSPGQYYNVEIKGKYETVKQAP